MRRLFALIAVLPLAGCLAGAAQGRSTTSYYHDDGIHPVQRTTVTQTHSGSSIGLPVLTGGYGGGMVMMGGGYSPVVMSGASCVLHPDNCAVIQTAAVVQPVTVVSSGDGGAGGADGGTVDTSDLEARIARLETAVPKLAGAGILSLKQSCYGILKDPGMIPDAAEREKIVAGCTKVLNANPSTEEK